jgi:hypothetical protein
MFKHSLEKVKKLYEKFDNESEVARELGVSRQFIYEYRKKHNIQYDKKLARISSNYNRYGIRNTEIWNLFIKGELVKNLCKKFNITESNVRFILNKFKDCDRKLKEYQR